MYQLISENLTNLGGPMGTEYTTYSNEGHFRKASNARAKAEKEYGRPIEWKAVKNGWRSPDLGHVMYHIKEVKFKD